MRRGLFLAKFGIFAHIHARCPSWSLSTGRFAASGASCENRGMDASQMISLDDVVLRDDLDPRLGQRDDGLIAQYAEIVDALPPIELNQDNALVDGWHRVRAAERAGRTEIAYIVVETAGDDDLADRMWAANLKHGVQYTRAQRQTQGLKLFERDLPVGDIAERVGVSVATVRRWTKALRAEQRRARDERILELSATDMSLRQIADEAGVDHKTVAAILGKNAQMREIPHEEAAPEIPEIVDLEPEKAPDDTDVDMPDSEEEQELETAAETLPEEPEPSSGVDGAPSEDAIEEDMRDSESGAGAETAPADEIPESELEPAAPEAIPDAILETAHAVMGAFSESRPDDYAARLEASPGEWMTITDDSLSNELERELLTSAAAMCLWQEWMIWYQGGRTNAFTDAFGLIGPVFVRGRSGQWRIVNRLRSVLRRLWA